MIRRIYNVVNEYQQLGLVSRLFDLATTEPLVLYHWIKSTTPGLEVDQAERQYTETISRQLGGIHHNSNMLKDDQEFEVIVANWVTMPFNAPSDWHHKRHAPKLHSYGHLNLHIFLYFYKYPY
ncbi:hypothetical protein BCR42DRAFT_403860 [Absidia repens]|uniref:Uncharacterized protein n=1 Tax=Absidia repens TaxID=90262 RepID=A0A1X2IVF7_9FUNG|nr:hypothetical protein BCR42DRAFT_403860 [Absidia repens]